MDFKGLKKQNAVLPVLISTTNVTCPRDTVMPYNFIG